MSKHSATGERQSMDRSWGNGDVFQNLEHRKEVKKEGSGEELYVLPMETFWIITC